MRASSLTSRITITGPTTTEDALGQPTTTWATIMTVWGDPRFKTGLQGVNAERIDSRGRVSIRIRQTPCSRTIKPGMRVTIAPDDTVYEIKDAPRQGRDALDLVCEAL
jgi:SPP1 family predicted phage head-tail adaptor